MPTGWATSAEDLAEVIRVLGPNIGRSITSAEVARVRAQIEARVDPETVPTAILTEASIRLAAYVVADARVTLEGFGDGGQVQTRPTPDVRTVWQSQHVGELLSPYIRRGSFSTTPPDAA